MISYANAMRSCASHSHSQSLIHSLIRAAKQSTRQANNSTVYLYSIKFRCFTAHHSANLRGLTLLLLLLFAIFSVLFCACLADEIRKCANSRRRVTCGVELQLSYVPPTLTNLNAMAMRGNATGIATKQCKK